MNIPDTLKYKVGYGNGITGPSAIASVYLDGRCDKTLVTADYPGNFSNKNELLSQVICICTGPKQREHAEYIVKACNLYPELVEMLEEARDVINRLPRSFAFDITHIPKMDNLLRKAKET